MGLVWLVIRLQPFFWMTELSVCLLFGQRAGLGPPCRPTFLWKKVGKEPAPAAHDPFAAFHFAMGQPAPSSSWGCTAKLTARLQRFAQTGRRKSDDDAVALCGATASPKNLPSQAWAQGAMREPDSFFIKLIAVSHFCTLA